MKSYIITKLTEDYTKEICKWKYEDEYAVYNLSDYEIVLKNGWDLAIEEKRNAEFVGIVYNDELIAYGRIAVNYDKCIIGVGLKPIFCGKGYGKDVMKLLINECRRRFPEKPITLEVRTFNERAIKCYLDVGFEIKDKYTKDTFNGEDEFYYMQFRKFGGLKMELKIINQDFSICKVEDLSQINYSDEFCFIGKTDEELSLVCSTNLIPKNAIECDNGWKAFRIQGVLDFSLIGILSKISALLADNEIGIFAVSTYNTDYILTKEENFDKAIKTLEHNGYVIRL